MSVKNIVPLSEINQQLANRTVKKRPKKNSKTTDVSPKMWERFGLPEPIKEHMFAKPRRFRIDFAWPAVKLAVEIDGGTYGRTVQCHNCKQTVKQKLKNGRMIAVRLGGRHNSSGVERDMEKLNLLAEHGWTVLRYIPKKINFKQIKAVYEGLVGGEQ
jgi:very-short-patch-repair endonuclease